MTLDELSRLAVGLSRFYHIRIWHHWNFPATTAWTMAISVHDYHGEVVVLPEQTFGCPWRHGEIDGKMVYVFERLDDSGRSYTKPLGEYYGW